MPSLYEQLEKQDSEYRHGSPAFLRTEPFEVPNYTGIKIAIVMAFILSLIALSGAWFLYSSLSSERSENKNQQLLQNEWQDEIGNLENQLEAYRGRVADLQSELEKNVAENQRLQRDVKEARALVQDLRDQVSEFEQRSVDLQSKLRNMEARNLPQAGPVEAVMPVVAPESGELEWASPADALPQETTQPIGTLPQEFKGKPLNAQILSVNRQFNFVVVNRGLQDQVRIGDRFSVRRGDDMIGEIEIEKLYDNFSAAAIHHESSQNQIQEGDEILTA
ncbi:MAG: hypothetical protein A2Z83_08665 [Omnitrophica bacterium GWA2_52_8]|nr:MAG: hypothetical protein A2Z83_08665 [Omnitrophica bacterium GWA2_52_8]